MKHPHITRASQRKHEPSRDWFVEEFAFHRSSSIRNTLYLSPFVSLQLSINSSINQLSINSCTRLSSGLLPNQIFPSCWWPARVDITLLFIGFNQPTCKSKVCYQNSGEERISVEDSNMKLLFIVMVLLIADALGKKQFLIFCSMLWSMRIQ